MGALALAGMVSGAGHGLERGLFNLQQGIIQSGLQGERDAMEQRRLALTFAHDTEVQQGKQAFEAGQTALKEEGAERRQAKDFEHREAMVGQEIGSREAMAEREAAQKAESHTEDIGLKREEAVENRKLEREKLKAKTAGETEDRKIKQSYYDLLMKKAEHKDKAAPADYKRFEIMERFMSDQAAVIRQQLKDLDPKIDAPEIERLQDELAALDNDLRGMIGVQQRVRPKAGAGIIDPFKGGPRP